MGKGQYGTFRTGSKSRSGPAAARGAVPGTVRPRMSKLYDGRNVATRPIPIISDYGDQLALMAAAANSKPLGFAVNLPSGPRPTGTGVIFGKPVAGAAKVRAGVWNPATGLGEHT